MHGEVPQQSRRCRVQLQSQQVCGEQMPLPQLHHALTRAWLPVASGVPAGTPYTSQDYEEVIAELDDIVYKLETDNSALQVMRGMLLLDFCLFLSSDDVHCMAAGPQF